MKEIRGEAKTLRQLLSGSKYAIDYYQREYRWQTKQVAELVQDLTSKFLEDYQADHERHMVKDYGHYFLGSVIISDKKGQKFIIDGQQRITTLTLLLICLHNRQKSRPDAVKIDDLIFSEKYGKKSFNLDVDERTPCMEALFSRQPFDDTDQPESVRNITKASRDIEQHFQPEIDDRALPYFTDWLIENVHLVEITAYSDEDAYTIFETMNDRGLSLSPTDMLKGYVLANIADEKQRTDASRLWKERIARLQALGKEEDSDAVKAWLRSQFAQTIRERKKGALPGDFDRLGTEFHRWVREHEAALGLKGSSDFVRFLQRDFGFYSRWYERLRVVAETLTPGYESVFYNAQQEFTLQYPLLLAPLLPGEDEREAVRKIQIVAAYIDILIARRLWNFRSISYSTLQYGMFVVMREIRGKNAGELATLLAAKLKAETDTFDSNDRLSLHGQNRFVIHHFLARMIDHIERKCGLASRYLEYVNHSAPKKNRYEVEHIWANKPDRFKSEFPNEHDFEEHRNRIGGLLLLPKAFNASYGDLPYEDKLEKYFGQNVLAQSLHPKCYDHNPRFLEFIKMSGLPFEPCPQFRKGELEKHQLLYKRLASQIWDPGRLSASVAGETQPFPDAVVEQAWRNHKPPAEEPPAAPASSGSKRSKTPESNGSEDDNLWETDGRTWHLTERCSPQTGKLLTTFIDLYKKAVPDAQLSWNQKNYVVFKIEGYNWAYLNTHRSYLDVRLWTLISRVDAESQARRLKVAIASDVGKEGEGSSSKSDLRFEPNPDAPEECEIRIRMRLDFDLQNPELPKILKEWRPTIS